MRLINSHFVFIVYSQLRNYNLWWFKTIKIYSLKECKSEIWTQLTQVPLSQGCSLIWGFRVALLPCSLMLLCSLMHLLAGFSSSGCWLEVSFSSLLCGHLHRAAHTMEACFFKVSKGKRMRKTKITISLQLESDILSLFARFCSLEVCHEGPPR